MQPLVGDIVSNGIYYAATKMIWHQDYDQEQEPFYFLKDWVSMTNLFPEVTKKWS